MKKPTYSDFKFCKKSEKKLLNILKHFGLSKDFKDDFHCTIVYSKAPIDFSKHEKIMDRLVKIKNFGHFDTPDGKNLHVELECQVCEKEHALALKAGASYDYDKYVPHITLCYDCKDFDYVDQGKDFIGETLRIIKQDVSPLNEDWLEDNKKEDKEKKDGKTK